MTLYTGPVFEMARQQFHIIADHLDIPIDERERLLLPKRAIAVSCPIHMDDGRTAVFQGFRVQHHLTLGPAKGGTRFAPGVDLGEVAALAVWMSWKCALAELPYGGGKGGVAVDPATAASHRRRRSPRLLPSQFPDYRDRRRGAGSAAVENRPPRGRPNGTLVFQTPLTLLGVGDQVGTVNEAGTVKVPGRYRRTRHPDPRHRSGGQDCI